jgi:hypothetical protein
MSTRQAGPTKWCLSGARRYRLLQLLRREPRDAVCRDPIGCLHIPEENGTVGAKGGSLFTGFAPRTNYCELVVASAPWPDA